MFDLLRWVGSLNYWQKCQERNRLLVYLAVELQL